MSTRGLMDFYRDVKRNESMLKHKCNLDSILPTKICTTLCSKVQRWLSQCEIARDRTEVNDSIVIFDKIIEDVLDNRFTVDLPWVFKIGDAIKPPEVRNPFLEEGEEKKNKGG